MFQRILNLGKTKDDDKKELRSARKRAEKQHQKIDGLARDLNERAPNRRDVIINLADAICMFEAEYGKLDREEKKADWKLAQKCKNYRGFNLQWACRKRKSYADSLILEVKQEDEIGVSTSELEVKDSAEQKKGTEIKTIAELNNSAEKKETLDAKKSDDSNNPVGSKIFDNPKTSDKEKMPYGRKIPEKPKPVKPKSSAGPSEANNQEESEDDDENWETDGTYNEVGGR